LSRNKAGRRITDGPYFETQAQRIVDKFGGPRNLSRALLHIGKKKDPSAIYKWIYEEAIDHGGGVIPGHAIHDVIQAARAEGIMLTPEDLDPRPRKVVPKVPQAHKAPPPSQKAWKPEN
jgi:hypothetical protein